MNTKQEIDDLKLKRAYLMDEYNAHQVIHGRGGIPRTDTAGPKLVQLVRSVQTAPEPVVIDPVVPVERFRPSELTVSLGMSDDWDLVNA